MQEIIKIEDGITRQTQYRLEAPINLTLNNGEHWAIIGSNGSGKSLLVGMLNGQYPLFKSEVTYNFAPALSNKVYKNITYLTFRDSYGESDGDYYYQQRWNSQDRELIPTVKDLLPENSNLELKDNIYQIFGIEDILDKEIILLSSGELRKFQLTKALLNTPRVIIIDNPFIGLDVNTREQLSKLLNKLSGIKNLQIVLVLSKYEEIPQFITHVIELKNKKCSPKIELNTLLNREKEASLNYHADTFLSSPINITLPCNLPSNPKLGTIRHSKLDLESQNRNKNIVHLNNVTIKYGEHTILKNLNWEIKIGEKWALSGENGAGKSTLLSLICADNPQGYACNISLFGRKRGSGESIWDIKKRIGYVSPEMHRAYLQYVPAIEIVCSGLFDTIGLYTKANEKEVGVALEWMRVFGIEELKDKNFMHLSSGEQRLILLARAFVKDPELLILDEPLHGLDKENSKLALNIIETFCSNANKTLIMVTHYKEELPSCITDYKHLTKPV